MRVSPTTSELEALRPELTRYCARLLRSHADAEDAVQETMLRAWRHAARFEGRSSLRAWVYRIARNVCLDVLGATARRAVPGDGAAWEVEAALQRTVDGHGFLHGGAAGLARDPAQVAEHGDDVRTAVGLLDQLLPPRQRVVLVLRDVLCWPASEVAETLGTSVASVNSALQRARDTLRRHRRAETGEVDETRPVLASAA